MVTPHFNCVLLVGELARCLLAPCSWLLVYGVPQPVRRRRRLNAIRSERIRS
jgi:hypothetical protein